MKKLLLIAIVFYSKFVVATPLEEGEAALNKQNYTLAITKYGDATANGNPIALIKLEVMFKSKLGKKEDFDQAIQKLFIAAKSGTSMAKRNLAEAYLSGVLIPKNCTNAVSIYKELASDGSATAQHNLGGLYLNGDCVTKDYVLGYMWRSLSSAQTGEDFDRKLLASYESKLMSSDQVATAQRLARECLKNKYQNCD
jgi:TPR repeat protein